MKNLKKSMTVNKTNQWLQLYINFTNPDVMALTLASGFGAKKKKKSKIQPSCDLKIKSQTKSWIWRIVTPPISGHYFCWFWPRRFDRANSSVNVHFTYLRTILIVSIVHHGHCPLLPVFDAWCFLCIKKASLVPIEFTNHTRNKRNFDN